MFAALSPEQGEWVNNLSDSGVIAVHDLTHRIMLARFGTLNPLIVKMAVTDSPVQQLFAENAKNPTCAENAQVPQPCYHRSGAHWCPNCGSL